MASLLGVNLHMNGFGLILNPLLCHVSAVNYNGDFYLRIVKDVQSRWSSFLLIYAALDVKRPQHSSDLGDNSLLSKICACADSTAPPECHMTLLHRKFTV